MSYVTMGYVYAHARARTYVYKFLTPPAVPAGRRLLNQWCEHLSNEHMKLPHTCEDEWFGMKNIHHGVIIM